MLEGWEEGELIVLIAPAAVLRLSTPSLVESVYGQAELRNKQACSRSVLQQDAEPVYRQPLEGRGLRERGFGDRGAVDRNLIVGFVASEVVDFIPSMSRNELSRL